MLGKPHNAEDAKAMLRALSAKTHQVYTAVTFAKKSQQPTANNQSLVLSTIVDCTDVTFAELTDADIDYYISQ